VRAVTLPAASPPDADPAEDLYAAFLALESPEEVRDFLSDLCTPAEVRAFVERWRVARLLDQGGLSYREIAEQANASPTTVVRVARFLKEMPYRGYRRVLDRLAQEPANQEQAR
jgi:TrpR-related protein YerC/YecD